MKSLLIASMLLGTVSVMAQGNSPATDNYPFPEKLSELKENTIRRNLSTKVGDMLLLLNNVQGPVVLRLCITKEYTGSAVFDSYVSAQVGKKVILDTEAMSVHDDSANNSQDFSLCKDTEFKSYKDLDGKSFKLQAVSGVRDYYVEVYPKDKPGISWPRMIRSSKAETYINLDLFSPQG